MKEQQELYACLYVREFPAQALIRLRPELRECPCVVMDGEQPAEAVCSLNTKARLLGLHHGMTRVEVETFEAVTLTRSLAAEHATRNVLLECAAGCSPRIEDCSEPGAFLCGIDISGTERLFGSPAVLAKTLRDRTRALGISSTVIVSSNLMAAVCLAKGGAHKPLQIIPQGHEAAALGSLSISVLDLTDAQAETLSLWGIQTLESLAALPERDLIARMGQQGKRLQEMARGELPHCFQPVEVPLVLEESRELEHPLDNLESLLFGISVMLEQLIVRAQTRALALASVTITMQLENRGVFTRTVSSRLPSSDRQLWLKLVHLDLQAHSPEAAIAAVALSAEPAARGTVQLGLFSPQLPEPGRLDVTLAKIAALVGEENVGRAVLEDTHRPDAFRLEPFHLAASEPKWIENAAPKASLRCLRPPARFKVTIGREKPHQFYLDQQRYTVENAFGPWLLNGEWWNGDTWDGEQWDLIARAQDGTRLFCCAVRDRLQNEWQIKGLYD